MYKTIRRQPVNRAASFALFDRKTVGKSFVALTRLGALSAKYSVPSVPKKEEEK